MITKKKNRYYCEYCKKSSGAAWAMKKHESRCTLNPYRHCGYCDLLDADQPAIRELMAILPNPKEYEIDDGSAFSYPGCFTDDLTKAVEAIMPKLRNACESCPACIMAALRQKGIPVPMVTSFDFKAECKSIWDDFNESKAEYY